jgi:hypothetical protein
MQLGMHGEGPKVGWIPERREHSLLLHARKNQPDRLRDWAHRLERTHVHNKAAVAVANKLARIVWAVWTHQRPFERIDKAA